MLRARLETALAVVLGLLALTTIFVPDWIEVFTGADPDGGDGAVEWAFVFGLVLLALLISLLARHDYARARRSQTSPGAS